MKKSQTASLEEIRAHFPALNRFHNGFPVAYFDGPGGTQVPRAVVEAMTDYLLNHNANTHWAFPTSRETDVIIGDARDALADFLNAAANEIIFGQNMTSLTFHLTRALGSRLSPGDEIIVTELDHHANIDSWRILEAEKGARIHVVPVDLESGTLQFDKLENFLNSKTKILALGAASNAIGTISDVKSACDLARENGTLSFVDAVHYAAHNLVDVKNIGCDFLACSAYKFYGPHLGILFGREELLEEIDFPKLKPASSQPPEKAETGTQSHESIAGAAAAVNFLAGLSEGSSRREKLENTFHELNSRKKSLLKLLWDELLLIKGSKVFGLPPEGDRTPTVSFALEKFNSREVCQKLAERGIFASNGDFYASTLVEKLGFREQGLVRIGCACYTTREEIERLIAGLRNFVK